MKVDRPAPPVTVRRPDRRDFLRLAGLGGAGLLLGAGWSLSGAHAAADATTTTFVPNAYLRIDASGIVVFAPNPEIGQGVRTALPMILAEELDAAWADIEVRQAPIDARRYPRQVAGGSRSVADQWLPLRRAGAMARELLRQAAAAHWQVPLEECRTAASEVLHAPSGRRLHYRELASAAAALPLPDAAQVPLKARTDFRLLGTRIGDVDARRIVTGAPLYGSDVRLAGQVYATYVRCPARGGRVAQANLEQVKTLPGVLDAFVLEAAGDAYALAAGVAIVAVDTWSALVARDTLVVQWDEHEAARDSWQAAEAAAGQRMEQGEGEVFAARGDCAAAFASAATRVEARYSHAFAAHATLEPPVATAWWHDGRVDIHAPSQTPQQARERVAQLFDLPLDAVHLHLQRAGGGFGRRLMNEAIIEAVAIARRVNAPVKLTWTRADDLTHDCYRPGSFHALAGALDGDGRLTAFRNHFVTFSHDGAATVIAGNLDAEVPPGPFVPNLELKRSLLPWRTPTGWWRAPAANTIAFAYQSFLHELSSAAGRDHLDFLLELLGEPRWLVPDDPRALHTGRAAAVLRRAAQAAGWGTPPPAGRARGLAFYFCHAGHVATVAEVGVGADRRLDVHRVVTAVDVGPVVNLSAAENQVAGSVMDGLSVLLGQRIDIEQGRVQQQNFDRYPLLRLPRAPAVEVHFVEGDFAPTGLGEPALPPVAPAVGNALFSLTGERVRNLPFSSAGWQ